MGAVDCDRCYQAIEGPVVRDKDRIWHPECRKEITVENAIVRADRYIRQNLSAARVLCELQRKPEAVAA